MSEFVKEEKESGDGCGVESDPTLGENPRVTERRDRES